MLGSVSETDDTVQEAWLRIRDQDPATVENMQAWLTTVVGRVCLNTLRSRRARREELSVHVPDPVVSFAEAGLEHVALVADSVGLALVVLDTLTPAERLAFVLHDVFGMPFLDIAAALDRSEAAARSSPAAPAGAYATRRSPAVTPAETCGRCVLRRDAQRRFRCPLGSTQPPTSNCASRAGHPARRSLPCATRSRRRSSAHGHLLEAPPARHTRARERRCRGRRGRPAACSW